MAGFLDRWLSAFTLIAYHLVTKHSLEILPCVMRLIDRECGAILNVLHRKVKDGLTDCVIVLLSNLSNRK